MTCALAASWATFESVALSGSANPISYLTRPATDAPPQARHPELQARQTWRRLLCPLVAGRSVATRFNRGERAPRSGQVASTVRRRSRHPFPTRATRHRSDPDRLSGRPAAGGAGTSNVWTWPPGPCSGTWASFSRITCPATSGVDPLTARGPDPLCSFSVRLIRTVLSVSIGLLLCGSLRGARMIDGMVSSTQRVGVAGRIATNNS
jgi:hypothetical protein